MAAKSSKGNSSENSADAQVQVLIQGTKLDEVFIGDDRSEFIDAKPGDDVVNGSAGDDRIKGGAGNDIVDGGAGSDRVEGGSGNDLAIYTLSENQGSADVYDGGAHIDGLQINLTRKQWMRDEVQQDIAGYLAFLEEHIDPESEEADGERFQFQAFDLEARKFEKLKIFVDGVELDPGDELVTALDDEATTDTEHSIVSANVLDNDEVPDLVRSVELIQTTAKGQLTFNSDGSFIYEPGNDFDTLAQGESEDVSFVYLVSDADHDSDTATVRITVSGTNDLPIANADLGTGGENEMITVDVLANDTDVDATDTHTIANANITQGLGSVSIVDNKLEYTALSEFALEAQGEVASEVESLVYDSLALGETATVTIDYTMEDNHGEASSSTLTLDVSGVNDAPTISEALDSSASEQDEIYTIDLLDGASDIDSGATLSAVDVDEASGKGGWSVNEGVLTVDPHFYDHLNNGDTETLTFNYQILDEHGASVDQSLTIDIEGFTDAPFLSVRSGAGARVNEIRLNVNSQPANNERLVLTFVNLAAGAVILDSAGNDVTAGVSDYGGSHDFIIVLNEDQDVNTDLEVTVTGIDDDGVVVGQAQEIVDLSYDVNTVIELVNFSAENQSMWGSAPDNDIGWHEYIPFVGTETDPWSSGKFNLVDIGIDLDYIAGGMLDAFQDVLNVALTEQANAVANLDDAEEVAAQALKKAQHIDDVITAWGDYEIKNGIYQAAKLVYDAAKLLADEAGAGVEDIEQQLSDARSFKSTLSGERDQLEKDARVYEYHWVSTATWNPATWADGYWAASRDGNGNHKYHHDPIKWLAVLAKDAELVAIDAKIVSLVAVETALAAGESGLDAAADALFPAMNEAETIRDAALVNANTQDAEMHADGFFVGQQVTPGDAITAWADHATAVVDVGLKNVPVGLAAAAVELAQAGVNSAQGMIDSVDFNADFKLDLEVYAKVGLQIDFELDLGSVDASLSYELTTVTQHNLTTDTLAITPLFVNKVTGESVAFSTLSPNATFYAGILYDVGANVDIFVDAALTVDNASIFDISPGQNGITLHENIGMDGTIVLVDFDSTEAESVDVPFIETLTEDIVSISLAVPTIETEGIAQPFSNSYFQEGGLLNIDFSEISNALFNFINAGIDFSPEIKAAFSSLASIEEGSVGFDAIVSAVGEVLSGIWDVVSGEADTDGDGVVPIFILDATDETNTSLLHLNVFPDEILSHGVDGDTGTFGFYVAYGESDPVVEVSIDIDQFVALVANVAIGNASGEVLNPLVKEYGLDLMLDLVDVPKSAADEIKKYVDMSLTFEYADLDVSTSWNFKQEFTLSVDDMLHVVTVEDGTTFLFAANDLETLTIENVSQYDVNRDGTVEYDIQLIPEAMFSNDTEVGMAIGYTLDFLKAELAAGIKIPLAEIFGIDALPELPVPFLGLGLGPLLRVQGDLDILDVDLFENRFDFNLGFDTVSGGVVVTDDVINGTSADDVLAGYEGNDNITGGAGNDLFVFANAHGDDIITDFVAGAGSEDVIDLQDVDSIASFADVQSAANDDGSGNTEIDLGAGNSVTLIGVVAASLHSDDFIV